MAVALGELNARDLSLNVRNIYGALVTHIDNFPVDAMVTESHAYESEVTEYPVEVGVDIADHQRKKPLKISIEGVFSDSPIGQVGQHSTRKDGTPSSKAYARLLEIRIKGEPVTICTSLGPFTSMVMSSFTLPRESGEPHGLRFKAEFVQVILVTNNRTSIRTATPAGKGGANLGERLPKLISARTLVFTMTQAQLKDQGDTVAGPFVTGHANKFGTPVLIDPKPPHDVHYEVQGIFSPPADGYVDATGYHSFATVIQASYDPSTGTWHDAKGNFVKGTRMPPSSKVGGQLNSLDWGSVITGGPLGQGL